MVWSLKPFPSTTILWFSTWHKPPLMSLMQWQLGHFSVSVREVSIVRISYILSGNTKPAFPPTQVFWRTFFLLWGRCRVWMNQISSWNISFYVNAWEIRIAQPLWFPTCQKQLAKSLLILWPLNELMFSFHSFLCCQFSTLMKSSQPQYTKQKCTWD